MATVRYVEQANAFIVEYDFAIIILHLSDYFKNKRISDVCIGFDGLIEFNVDGEEEADSVLQRLFGEDKEFVSLYTQDAARNLYELHNSNATVLSTLTLQEVYSMLAEVYKGEDGLVCKLQEVYPY
jgi:hypothetical protein